jgi:hypothetical protein
MSTYSKGICHQFINVNKVAFFPPFQTTSLKFYNVFLAAALLPDSNYSIRLPYFAKSSDLLVTRLIIKNINPPNETKHLGTFIKCKKNTTLNLFEKNYNFLLCFLNFSNSVVDMLLTSGEYGKNA